MTSIYLVRHALPEMIWEDEESRPLAIEATLDCQRLKNILLDVPIDEYFSGPNKCTIDTIEELFFKESSKIHIDERFKERTNARSNKDTLYNTKSWSDFQYKDVNGESLREVQRRSIKAINDILTLYKGKKILISTHLSSIATILNYYDKNFDFKEYLRIYHYMPYTIRLDFLTKRCIQMEEIHWIEKEIF